MKRMKFHLRRGAGKVSPGLLALGSSVVLTAYVAGWLHVRQLPDEALEAGAPSSLFADTSGPPIASARAPETTAARVTSGTAIPDPLATPGVVYRDGAYSGSGENVHGGVTVGIVIAGGRIVSAEITRCFTRYPCAEIESLPGQLLERQSARLRYVTGATDSSRAFVKAVEAALAKASM